MISLILIMACNAYSQEYSTQDYYVTKGGFLTNIPSEGAIPYGSYAVKQPSAKELAHDKLKTEVINEVNAVFNGIKNYKGKSTDYINKVYKFKPAINITLSARQVGQKDEFTIYGRHDKLEGFYSLDYQGNAVDELK